MLLSIAKPLYCGIFALLTLLSGFAVSFAGRPYNGALFNIHKLIAVGAVVVIGATVYYLGKDAEGRALLNVASAAAAGLFFLALIVTGGLLSLDIARPVALRLHQVAPALALAFAALAVYLAASSRVASA